MRKALVVFAAAALAACGGGGGSDTPTGTNPGGQTPTLTLSISPATLSIQQSGSNTVAITIARGGGLAANVDLSVEGAPSGVTASFAPASLANGVTSSTLTLSASSTAATGTASVTIRAKSTGVSDQTASLALTVAAASSAGGFTLSTTPATIVQGASGSSTVTIARTGSFSGAVALTVTGAPTGVTATLNPTSVTGTTSTLSLAAAASTTPGTYSLTVSGTGTGVANQSATVAVTVQAATSGTGNIAWTYCANAVPLWFAVQDGSGAWTRVTPDANSAFKFSINSATGGVAVVTQATNSFTTNITYGSAAELTSQAATCVGGGQKTLTGTVAGLGSNDLAAIAMGGSVATPTASNTSFTLTNVAGGPQDLLAVLSSQTISGTSIVFAAKKGIIRRSLNLANNAAIPVLDFNAAEAFTPASATLTMANGGSDLLTVALGYFTANGSSGSFTAGLPSNTASQTYYGVPAANQANGDFHALISSALATTGTSVTQIRTATKFFKTVADQTLTFGAAPNAATVSSAATTPVVRLRAQWNVQSDYNKLFTIGYTQTVAGIARQVNITATAAALGGSPTAVDLTIPDLSGVTGFDTNWGLKTGTAVTWFVSSSGWSFAAGPFGGSPAEGGIVLGGSKLGSFTP